jgi:hypothetical protein
LIWLSLMKKIPWSIFKLQWNLSYIVWTSESDFRQLGASIQLAKHRCRGGQLKLRVHGCLQCFV